MSDYDEVIKNIKECKAYYSYLIKQGEVSFASHYHNQSIKSSILSIASFFESEVTSIVYEMLKFEGCEITRNFIYKRGLERQYHQLFNWSQSDANQFYSFFGRDFLNFMKEKIKNNKGFKDGSDSFMYLGSLRNRLVHTNYITFKIDLSIDEIYFNFEKGMFFINNLKPSMEEFRNINKSHE